MSESRMAEEGEDEAGPGWRERELADAVGEDELVKDADA